MERCREAQADETLASSWESRLHLPADSRLAHHALLAGDGGLVALGYGVTVPFGIHLHMLHLVILAAMGWSGSHLWLIEARDMTWGMPDPEDNDILPAGRTVLIDLVADTGARTFDYIYDLGDDWRHTVKIETPTPSAPGVDYPLLLEATGRCPPEDYGGPWGYRDMLDALRDPKHQGHAEVVERLGSDFDPAAIDGASLEKAVAGLARLLSGKKSRKPQPRKRTPGDPNLF